MEKKQKLNMKNKMKIKNLSAIMIGSALQIMLELN